MAATVHRTTLASNANRSIKAPFLIPQSPTKDALTAVFATAKSKLRLKKPARIFTLTGLELSSSAELLTQLATAQDQTLLISSGEDFVGLVSDSSKQPKGAVTVIAEHAAVEDAAVKQLHACAALPGITRAVGLPDLHPGTQFPIGCAFVSEGWLHPPLIGSDIGCGMSWYRTLLAAGSLEARGDLERTAGVLRGVEAPWKEPADRIMWLGGEKASAGNEHDKSLGTIGAGNHFAELQVVDHVDSGFAASSPVQAGDVVLLVHSGSRGFGKEILNKFYTPGSETSIEAETEGAQEYLALHEKACTWAQANRDLIAFRFLQLLEPGEWDGKSRAEVEARKFVDIHHNNVVRTKWPPSSPSKAEDDTSAVEEEKYVYIHRKGAAPCTGSIPLLPLPGSRGTSTLLLQPILTEETSYGLTSALSAAHGAGRAMSRTKAAAVLRKKYDNDPEYLRSQQRKEKGRRRKADKSGDDFTIGDRSRRTKRRERRAGSEGSDEGSDDDVVKGHVVCDDKELVWEEAPEAYKDVECVGRDLQQAGVARVVGMARPRVTYKVRHSSN